MDMSLIRMSWKEQNLPLTNNSQIYIQAEATPENHLLSYLEFHQPNYRSLWKVEKSTGLEMFSPYLIEAGTSEKFDCWIEEKKEVIPYTLISTTLTTEKLFVQLKFFTKLSATQGGKYFLRIGSSPMFHLYVTSIASNNKAIEKLFANGFITGYLFQNEKTNLLKFYRPIFEREHSDDRLNYQFKDYVAWLDLNQAVKRE